MAQKVILFICQVKSELATNNSLHTSTGTSLCCVHIQSNRVHSPNRWFSHCTRPAVRLLKLQLYIPHKDCSLQTRCLVTVQGGTLTDPASNGLFRECTALWGNINMVRTNNIADILCNYAGARALAGTAFTPIYSLPIVMDSVSCSGTESSLGDCTYLDSNNLRFCSHREDARVHCPLGNQ